MLLSYFFLLNVTNRSRNRKIWNPFFENLEAMKNFSLKSENKITLVSSDIKEFQEMNREILLLTDKVRVDFQNLKQFTEDISHEMQTPLAIIQAKIENIINGEDINSKQFDHFTSIQRDIKRLKQLNSRLTLLTKIDNNQFTNIEHIDFAEIVVESCQNFSELFQGKLIFSEIFETKVTMDKSLAIILCNNLISNAIKHTSEENEIVITLKNQEFTISNTGSRSILRPEMLFDRFYHESKSRNSTGLGLAIVKKICDRYAFGIFYRYEDNEHIFNIRF